MVVLLACWCTGLLVGQLVLGPAGARVALAAAAVAIGCAVPAALWSRPSRRPLVASAGLILLLVGGWRGGAAVHVPGPDSLDGYIGRQVSVSGTVGRSSGGSAFQSFWLTDIQVSGRGLAGIAQVTERSAIPVVPGTQVRVSGTLERLPGRALDGTSGYDDRMEREGVLATLPAAGVVVLAPAPRASPPAMAWRLRGAMAAAVRAAAPEPEATILLGELVGIRGTLPPDVESNLVASGLVHLLAVSGLKVALVAGTLAALLRRAGRRAALLAIAGIFAYALLGGASSAAFRSALMGSLALVAQVLRRDVDPARSLLLAAGVVLGLHPALVGDLSFQYSFLGVAGIQLLQGPLERRCRWVPRPFREALTVSVAAQLATLPLTAAYFHVVSISGALANALAVPFLPLSMGLAGWLAATLPDAGGIPAAAATGTARALLVLAAGAARAPAGALAVPWFALPHVIAYYAGAAVLVVAGRLQPPLAFRVTAAFLAAAAVAGWAARPDGRVRIAVLETPGGGAVVTAPDGARLLVDTGASPPALAAALDAQLGPGSGVDSLLLSGSSPGAAGGLAGLGRRYPSLVLLPAVADGDAAQLGADGLAAHGSAVQLVAAGDRLAWHGIELELGTCGAGLSLTLRHGDVAAWFCSGATAWDPGTLPAGRLEVADTGDGKLAPDGDLDQAAWVVQHSAAAARGGVSSAGLGGRLWRAPKDGPLLLTCDNKSCSR
jgi:competence protein ComEC